MPSGKKYRPTCTMGEKAGEIYAVNSCYCVKDVENTKVGQADVLKGDIILSFSPLHQKFENIFRWIHCAHIACIRNSIRGRSKQFPFIREIEDPTTFRWQECLYLGKNYQELSLY